jgi:DNA-binding transcriptional ArsR family regulator
LGACWSGADVFAGAAPVGRREHRVRFWVAIARGLSSEDAALAAGVSAAVGVRWFREGGGMPSVALGPLSGRYLSFAEREEIAILRARGCGVREIARRLGRSPSTVSRELRRNAATRGGRLEYRAATAQWHADRRGRRPKPAKLAVNQELRRYVQDRLSGAVERPDGTRVAGPTVRWVGRRRGRRQDRRWATTHAGERGKLLGLNDLLSGGTGAGLALAGGLTLSEFGVTQLAVGATALVVVPAIWIAAVPARRAAPAER